MERRILNFLNLTAGLEWQPYIPDYRTVRIQSTACEQKRWGHILITLGAEFLYSLSCGCEVVVYDCGARKDTSRAIWQGLSWIKYAAQTAWKLPVDVPVTRGCNVSNYFRQMYRELPKAIVVELAAYRKYVTGDLSLSGICTPVGLVADATIGGARRLVYPPVIHNGGIDDGGTK